MDGPISGQSIIVISICHLAKSRLLDTIIIHLNDLFLAFQILNLCQEKEEIERKVHTIIDKFAERGLRSLAVAFQVLTLLHLTYKAIVHLD